MRLRELRIEASRNAANHAAVPPGFVFRWTAHHVREMFVSLLPRKYTLDGSAVVQVTCGPRRGEPQYHRVLGSSEYFVEDFDFRSYAASSAEERQETLLKVVERALVDICRRSGVDPTPVVEAATSVRHHGFRMVAEVARLRKRIIGYGVVHVLRSLSAEHGETWLLRVDRGHGPTGDLEVIGQSPSYIDRRDFYHHAEVLGSVYVLKNRLGRETFHRDFGDAREQPET